MKKEKLTLYFENFHISGSVQFARESDRVTDYFNLFAHKFVPLTDVTVFDVSGKEIGKEPFVCINKDKIIMIKDGGTEQ